MNKVDSLHPGNGGNPAFSSYDLDKNMRMVFYPAVFGWIMTGLWIANISIRSSIVRYKQLRKQFSRPDSNPTHVI
jgi:heme exporter protein C